MRVSRFRWTLYTLRNSAQVIALGTAAFVLALAAGIAAQIALVH